MDAEPEKPVPSLLPDEVNRLWQHGMHEERLFHDRLNYFSAIQVGLLGVFAILDHREPSAGIFAPLTAAALAAPGRKDGLSISRPLAFAVPLLFGATWVALFGWVLARPYG